MSNKLKHIGLKYSIEDIIKMGGCYLNFEGSYPSELMSTDVVVTRDEFEEILKGLKRNNEKK